MADVDSEVVLAAVFVVLTTLSFLNIIVTGLIGSLQSGFHHLVGLTGLDLSDISTVSDTVVGSLFSVPFQAVVFGVGTLTSAVVEVVNALLRILTTILTIPLWLLKVVYFIAYGVASAIDTVIGWIVSLVAFIVNIFLLTIQFVVVCSVVIAMTYAAHRYAKRHKLTLRQLAERLPSLLREKFTSVFIERRHDREIESALKRLFGGAPPSATHETEAGDVANIAPPPGESDEVGRECIVCYDNGKDTVIFPCGHAQFCGKCVEAIYMQTSKCPVCNGWIHEYRKIYV